MYCSGCGLALAQNQTVCPQCGQTVIVAAPFIPSYAVPLQGFSRHIHTLGVVWFIYAGLTLIFGFLGMAFTHAFLSNHFGAWSHIPPHAPWSNNWPQNYGAFALFFLRFAWVFLFGRVALAFAAGWGLCQHAPWGRAVAIVAAVINLLHFPLGMAMGIWTLVLLLGYRNTTRYEQLPQQ